MKNKEHKFGPGDTVQGIIRKYNRHDMSQELVDKLIKLFNKINEGKSKVPRVGEVFTIPIHQFTQEEIQEIERRRQPIPPKEPEPIVDTEDIIPIGNVRTEEYIVPNINNVVTLELKEHMKTDEMKAILTRQKRREHARKAIAEGKPLPVYRKTSKELGQPVENKEVEKPKIDTPKVKPKKTIDTNFEKPVEEIEEETKKKTKPTRISRFKKEEKQEDYRIFHRKRPVRR